MKIEQELLLSIIVPVYNAENQIRECIASIIKPDRSRDKTSALNYELILVDDGSTDRSGEICEEYAKAKDNIRVIHTKNQGQGLARNTGLRQAAGKYVYFADADDQVLMDGIRRLLAMTQNNSYDVIAGCYYRKIGQKTELVGGKYKKGTVVRNGEKEETERYHKIKTSSLFGYLWNKLYRREFLEEKELRLDDIREIYMEDTLFNLKVFSKSPVYYLSNIPVYCYNAKDPSTTRRAEPYIADKYGAMLNNYYKFLEVNGVLEENLDLFVPLALRVFCWSLVKNIPYEGLSLRALRKRIRVFQKNKAFRLIQRRKQNDQYLKKLPQMPERLFYWFCFHMLRSGKERQLSLIFILLEPFMAIYIRMFLK